MINKILCCCKKKDFKENIASTEPEDPEALSGRSSIQLMMRKSLQNTFLQNFIRETILFRGIPPDRFFEFQSFFNRSIIDANRTIIPQGEPLTKMYILEAGTCEVYHNQKLIKIGSPNFSFSEKCLLSSYISPVKVITCCKSTFWTLEKSDFERIIQDVRIQNKATLLAFFKEITFFSQLSEDSKNRIAEASYTVSYLANEKICTEGEEPLLLYIIKKGTANVVVNKIHVNTFYDSHLFGELSLVSSRITKRTATIICTEETEVILIDIGSIINIIGPECRRIFLKNIVMHCLIRDVHAKYLPKNLINSILDQFAFYEKSAGELVFDKENNIKTHNYVICYGKISSLANSFPSYTLIGFENENSFKFGSGIYRSDRVSVIGCVEVKKIERIIGMRMHKFVDYANRLVGFQKIKFFRALNFNEFGNFIEKGVPRMYKKGQKIYAKGDSNNFIYLIQQGVVGIYEDDQYIFRHDSGFIFGEECISIQKRINSAEALSDVSILEYAKSDVLAISYREMNKYQEKLLYYITPFELKHIHILKKISTSNDRETFTCELKASKNKYLAEVIYKRKVNDMVSFLLTLNQKCVVSQLQHPHIPRFLRAHSDKNCVYFFYEYLEFDVLSNYIKKGLSKRVVKFIIISVFCVLEYLHSKNILHRDINPKNIYIEKSGYAKLGGFKYSKQSDRCFTVLDTSIEYKAKEVIKGKGYIKESDLWSCGIVLFEMLTGKLPFGIEDGDEYIVITEKVLNNDIEDDLQILKGESKFIVKELLKNHPEQRISIESIMHGTWARGLEMIDFYYEKITPEFFPDTDHFKPNGSSSALDLDHERDHKSKKHKVFLPWDTYF